MALTRPRYSSIVDSDFKQSVRTVTTENINLVGGAPNVYDGITLSVNDSLLVNAQANAAQNGIYSVSIVGTGSNGTWNRRFDATDGTRLTSGTQVPIADGTYAGAVYRLITPDPITINVSNLTFIQSNGYAGGTNTQVQYNNVGALTGASDFLYFNGNGEVRVGGNLLAANRSLTVSPLTNSVASWTYDSVWPITGNWNDIFLGPDGYKLYIIAAAEVREYDLIAPYDISTSVPVNVAAFSTAGVDNANQGLWFNATGTKMYTCGQTSVANVSLGTGASEDRAYEYNLSIPWQVNSATVASTIRFSAAEPSGAETAPTGIYLSDDLTVFYMVGSTLDRLHQYTLSTPGNLATASYVGNISLSGIETGVGGISFNADFTKMYLIGTTGDDINEFNLATAGNALTATFSDRTYVGLRETAPNGIYYSPTANVAFITGTASDSVYKFRTNVVGATVSAVEALARIDLAGDVRIRQNLFVEGGIATDSPVAFNSTLAVGSSLSAGAITGTSSLSTTTNADITSSTTSSLVRISYGAVTAATTKFIQIGPNGVSGSFTNVTIGSEVVGASGFTKIAGGNLLVLPTTPTTSATTGALIVNGGTAIGGNLFVTGNLTANAGIGGTTQHIGVTGGTAYAITQAIGAPYTGTIGLAFGSPASPAQFMLISVSAGKNSIINYANRDFFIQNTAGAQSLYVTDANSNVIINSTTSTTSDTTGALVVRGGAGIGGNLWVGGNLFVSNLVSIATTTLSITDPMLYLEANVLTPYNYDIGFFSHFIGGSSNNYQHTGLVRDADDATWKLFANIKNEPGATIDFSDPGRVWDRLQVGDMVVANTTVSSSSTTGALVVSGGTGIAGNLFVAGITTVSNNTNATTSTNGALVVAGGVGVAGDIVMAGRIIASGSSSIFGNDTNSVILNTDGGAVEITRSAGDAYIDFKNQNTDDFDVRIQSVGNTNPILSLSVQGANNALLIYNTANVAVAGNLSIGANVNHVDLMAGTTASAPLTFTAGALNTVARAGAIEYDGKVMYGTTQSAERGLMPMPQIYANNADRLLAAATTYQDPFNKTFAVTSNTRYYYELQLYVSKTNATVNAFQYGLSNTAVISSHTYMALTKVAAARTTPTTVQSVSNRLTTGFGTSANISVSAAAAATFDVRINGWIDIGVTGGTINPIIALTNTTPTAPTVIAQSHMMIYPVGPISANTSI